MKPGIDHSRYSPALFECDDGSNQILLAFNVRGVTASGSIFHQHCVAGTKSVLFSVAGANFELSFEAKQKLMLRRTDILAGPAGGHSDELQRTRLHGVGDEQHGGGRPIVRFVEFDRNLLEVSSHLWSRRTSARSALSFLLVANGPQCGQSHCLIWIRRCTRLRLFDFRALECGSPSRLGEQEIQVEHWIQQAAQGQPISPAKHHFHQVVKAVRAYFHDRRGE